MRENVYGNKIKSSVFRKEFFHIIDTEDNIALMSSTNERYIKVMKHKILTLLARKGLPIPNLKIVTGWWRCGFGKDFTTFQNKHYRYIYTEKQRAIRMMSLFNSYTKQKRIKTIIKSKSEDISKFIKD